jgi:hypothetical protein
MVASINHFDNHYDWYDNGYGVKALQREAVVTIKDNDRQTNIRIETIQHGIEGEQDIFIRLHRDQTAKPLTKTFEYNSNAGTTNLGTDFYRLFLNFPIINSV